jgi:hypothetical protein
MDAKHSRSIIKCPSFGCKHNIRISTGVFVHGINDYGGWILQCDACDTKFTFPIQNPKDASSVLDGARILAEWDNETEDKAYRLADVGPDVIDGHRFEPILLPDIQTTTPKVNTDEHHLYHCEVCAEELESKAYNELTQQLGAVNQAVNRFLTVYLKGYASDPEGIRVSMPLACQCGHVNDVTFYKPFTEQTALSAESTEFWLVGAGNETALPDVDGVYSRNECFGILEKLLLRWQARFHAVFIIVPFVGLQFPGTEAKRLEQWNRILEHTDPTKTAIVTRRATFKLLREAAESEGISFSFLEEYGILNETIRKLSSKNASFQQDSHAKIYCGLSSDGVEVLNGSFNIHDGEYAENICVKSYEVTDFFSRYLFNLGIMFDFTKLRETRTILEIRLSPEGAREALETYTGSLSTSRTSSTKI